MLAAAFLFAVLDGLIKLLGPPFRVWDIAFYRFACGLVILVPILGWKGNPFRGQNLKLLVIRGIIFLGEPVTWRFWLGGTMILGSAVALNRGNVRRVSYRGIPGE
jgi:drug/metabolite transporter (DMT)-like permease